MIRFMAETVKPVRIADARSMNLLVRVPGRPADAMGYTHAFTPESGIFESAGRRAVYCVSAAELGIDASRPFTLEFKWSDNRKEDDPMDFYVNGDAAPRGRINWLFIFEPALQTQEQSGGCGKTGLGPAIPFLAVTGRPTDAELARDASTVARRPHSIKGGCHE